MVGQYIIEDEYTINIKVKRDANSPDTPTPLLTLSCSDSVDDQANASLSECSVSPKEERIFTLQYRQSDPLISDKWENFRYHQEKRGESQPPPTLRLVPHSKAHIEKINASHFVNGSPEKSNLFVHGGKEDKMVREIVCKAENALIFDWERCSPTRYDYYKGEQTTYSNKNCNGTDYNGYEYMIKPPGRKQSIVKMIVTSNDNNSLVLKPLSGFDNESEVNDILKISEVVSNSGSGTTNNYNGIENKDVNTKSPSSEYNKIQNYLYRDYEEKEKDDVGKYPTILPSLKVFDNENSLVSENSFTKPNIISTRDRTREVPGIKPRAPGSLFVRPIAKHCPSGSGELYVAPVDSSIISAAKIPPNTTLKGNSKRKKKKEASESTAESSAKLTSDCVSEILSNSGPTILNSSGGGNDRSEVGEVTSLSSTNSNFYKSSHIERKKEVMLVTNEPISATHMALPCSHYTNNNNILNTGINDSYHQRAAKYFIENSPPPTSQPPLMVKPCDDLVVGDSVYGQDNLGFDSSFNFIPYGEIRSLDPGYGSERSDNGDGDEDIGDDDDRSYSSEEEECSPNNRHSYIEASQEGIRLDVEYLMKIFPFINESTLFDITVFKNSRGLGLAVTGGIECDTGVLPGLIRIRKIYPQTPAWLCGQLQVNDFLLEANCTQLTGLTSHEALEVLRVAGNEVNLVVCRAPEEVLNGKNDLSPEDVNDQGIVSTSLTCPQTLSGSHLLSPSPSSYSMCGEFEIVMKKVAGSLGFTLRKNDNSILGHTIRSLVKEPAISDGRLRPGDKLLSVNGTDMCGLSHEEAVQFLRTCPETVVIRIYRDAIQTPVSPASPTELEPSKPKALRKEARDMLTDLAFKKQSSPNLAESDLPSTSRRRRLKNSNNPGGSKAERWESLVRKAEEESNDVNKREVSPFDNSNSDTLTANSSPSGTVVSCSSSGNSFKEISRPSSPTFIINPLNSENKPRRPDFLDLTNSYSSKKSQFTPPHEDSFIPSPAVTQFSSLESAPQITSAQSDTPAFTHLQSCYRSVNVGSSSVSPFSEQRLTNTSSDHNICHEEEYKSKRNALIKWKGVVFTPEAEKSETSLPDVEQFFTEQESGILTIEMTRGWNSRLGFSLQNGANGTDTEIVAIYEDSLAARDGRLKVGDVILEVNEHDVREWKTQDVIDLLRKTRGRIVFKILQKENIDS